MLDNDYPMALRTVCLPNYDMSLVCIRVFQCIVFAIFNKTEVLVIGETESPLLFWGAVGRNGLQKILSFTTLRMKFVNNTLYKIAAK